MDTETVRINSKRAHGDSCAKREHRISRHALPGCGTLLWKDGGVSCIGGSSLGCCVTGQSTTAKTGDETGKGTAVNEDGDRADLECIASVEGANNLVQALRRSLGTQIIANMEEFTDKWFHGGIGREDIA